MVVAGSPAVLQAPVNPYDGGLVLTLSRFTSWSLLPYRDLWTLYGPGPPIYGSILMNLFGRGTLPSRLGFISVQAALVLAVYLIARRYTGRWLSVALAAPIATIAVSEFQFHFAWSAALALWGAWFVLRSGEAPRRRVGRAAVGAFLMGMSFWGRYEFASFAVLLVIATWLWLRPSFGKGGSWVLAAGLTPPLLFGIYLVIVVGVDRAWFNLIEHPIRYYPQPHCRGLPAVWGVAFESLIAPVRGRLWTAHDVVLSLGTFGPPVVGSVALGLGAARWKRREPRALVMALLGATALFVWIELRVRAGAAAEPTWAPLMAASACALSPIRSSLTQRLAAAVPIVLIILAIVTSWAPANLPAWLRWPRYDPLYGYANLDETFLFDRQEWGELTGVVHRYAGPGAPVFVALTTNTGHLANMSLFYWVVDRPPGSRFVAFEACLTDRAPVQREIVAELEDTNVVIQTPYFQNPPPPFAPPSTVLDDYLRRHFQIVYESTILNQDDIVVLVRRGTDPHEPP
jgi:hypothetical protein